MNGPEDAPKDPMWQRLMALVNERDPATGPLLVAANLMSEDKPRRLYVIDISPEHIELTPPEMVKVEPERSISSELEERGPTLGMLGRLLLRREEVRGVEITERRRTWMGMITPIPHEDAAD